jgi:hypothetical protein
MAAASVDPTHGERFTFDISADLRSLRVVLDAAAGAGLGAVLLGEAADKLDGLIELLAEAEQARDTARAEADTWWKRSETQVDTIASLRQHSETLNSVAYAAAEALGDVRDGEPVLASPERLVGRLIAERNAARLQQTITESAARVLAKERDQALKRVRELEDRAGVDPFEPPAREAQCQHGQDRHEICVLCLVDRTAADGPGEADRG